MSFPFFKLTFRSLANRWFSALLTILAIALSVILFTAIENTRKSVKNSFSNTITGVDLIAGQRNGQINLLLFTVFNIGEGAGGIKGESYNRISHHPSIDWMVPISLGDSHRNFRVIGTTPDYFQHYKYGDDQPLRFAKGRSFAKVHEVVIGAAVAQKMNYEIGTMIKVGHGVRSTAISEHDERFFVSGILKHTGTPVDDTVLISLKGLDVMHGVYHDGYVAFEGDYVFEESLTPSPNLYEIPKKLTAIFIGTKTPQAAVQTRFDINGYKGEPMTAIMPGHTLMLVWQTIGSIEMVLLGISGFVIFIGLFGMMTSLLTGLKERRREMAIFRAMGARPRHIMGLLVSESVVLSTLGTLLGFVLVYGGFAVAKYAFADTLSGGFARDLVRRLPTHIDVILLAVIVMAGIVMALIPAYISYKRSLNDGLKVTV